MCATVLLFFRNFKSCFRKVIQKSYSEVSVLSFRIYNSNIIIKYIFNY